MKLPTIKKKHMIGFAIVTFVAQIALLGYSYFVNGVNVLDELFRVTSIILTTIILGLIATEMEE